MSILLAIETSTLFSSIAVLNNSILLYTEFFENLGNFSKKILFIIQKFFKKNFLDLSFIDVIAIGIGPGSFTGIKIAFIIAQSFSFNKNIPIIPIVTFEAMSQFCFDNFKKKNILSIIDANNNKFYWSQYKFINYNWVVVINPVISSIFEILPKGNVFFCGDKSFFKKKKKFSKIYFIKFLIEANPHAIQIARLGYKKFKNKEYILNKNFFPIYLKNI
ncbi:tRNA (adenosine(37)-N6)-threonylcarbamoyltransferase complex dimerization subunit type 1 TsaB [Candidatus Zinderia endosymbiont of Aphrophora alni]|uniref:tRNA (adenosine(37)-N6)-threonylcarbamoyltransferase complex dimerization subunit type 1 TsaB n=1 Tax=Candidatus Zinderia endosymbiont of Aphrophora alni TaxID=3077951 RepID=UPI0030D53EE9